MGGGWAGQVAFWEFLSIRVNDPAQPLRNGTLRQSRQTVHRLVLRERTMVRVSMQNERKKKTVPASES